MLRVYTIIRHSRVCSILLNSIWMWIFFWKRILFECESYLNANFDGNANSIGMWLLLECDFYWNVTSIGMWILLECEFYGNVNYFGMWILLECEFYWNVNSIGMRILLECEFYLNTNSIKIRILLECNFWSKKYGNFVVPNQTKFELRQFEFLR